MNVRRLQQGGFTLTEVLVASMLLSIVMTAVYTLFYTVIGTWRSEENDGGQHRRARALLTLMERDYANLHGGGGYFFEGTSDEVTLYVVDAPLDVEAGEERRLMQVRYKFNSGNGTVSREEATVDGSLPVATAEAGDTVRVEVGNKTSLVVATGVSKFELRYLWVQRPDGAYFQNRPVPVEPVVSAKHRRGWGLPQALEIDLSMEGSDDKTPPLDLQARFPTRTLNRQRDGWELARMVEATP